MTGKDKEDAHDCGDPGCGHDHHHHAVPAGRAFNPFRQVGRNDPCPCGSGQKFKKCCQKSAA